MVPDQSLLSAAIVGSLKESLALAEISSGLERILHSTGPCGSVGWSMVSWLGHHLKELCVRSLVIWKGNQLMLLSDISVSLRSSLKAMKKCPWVMI